MDRDTNKKRCKENLIKLQEEHFNDRIISDIVDLAYCNGYNAVLDAAENVLSNEDYFKVVKQLEEEK